MTSTVRKHQLCLVIAALSHACNDEPCEGGFLDPGDYMVSEVVGPEGSGVASHPWLEGARVHVDRAAGSMTIRYERDGSTYEVRYTLQE